VLDAPVLDPVQWADALYYDGEPEEAFEVLRTHLADHPEDYDVLWRVVRSTIVLGVASEGWRRQNSWWDTGMAYGDRAVAARPDGVEGRYWRSAAYGRRATNAAAEYGAELAEIAYEDAHAILAMQPDHGGAHNILGKIFFEIMSMSRIERWVGRTFVRTDALKESSWEAAELHLQAAAADWPESVQLQYDLAELYRKRGRDDEARAAYERVTRMSPVHPTDLALQQDAARMIADLGS
jgi:tetratricopeptide (TPR) repeat protein